MLEVVLGVVFCGPSVRIWELLKDSRFECMQRQRTFYLCRNSQHEEVNSQSKMVATTREACRSLLKPINSFPVAVGSPSSGLFELTGYLYTFDSFIP